MIQAELLSFKRRFRAAGNKITILKTAAGAALLTFSAHGYNQDSSESGAAILNRAMQPANRAAEESVLLLTCLGQC
jgi:hypothetical protein